LVIISAEDDGIFLRIKHIGANYEPWEKDEPNTYLLLSVENDKASLSTPRHPRVFLVSWPIEK